MAPSDDDKFRYLSALGAFPQLRTVFEAVFRSSTKQPGFYYEDFGVDLDSQSFRQVIVDFVTTSTVNS